MHSKNFLTKSSEETVTLAQTFSKNLNKGDVIGLLGDLGGGKTVFAKGMIAELTGTPIHAITSPTFTIVEEYSAQFSIFHVDLYRLDREKEIMDLSWDEMLGPNAITIIEWPERSDWVLSHCKFCVKLSKEGKDQRRIEILSPENR